MEQILTAICMIAAVLLILALLVTISQITVLTDILKDISNSLSRIESQGVKLNSDKEDNSQKRIY